MLKNVLSVVLVCGAGYAMIVAVAFFVKWLGPKLPQDPPVLSASAEVIAKREEKHAVSTRYFVTFRMAGDERVEFPVDGEQYGLLLAGDKVDLTYQEKKLIDFQRL